MVPKVLLVLAQKEFDDAEYATLLTALEGSGCSVLDAAATLKASIARRGAVVKPDLMLEQIKLEDWAAIVFVGGKGSRQYWDDPGAHQLVEAAWAADRLLGALDTACVILAKCPALAGTRLTGDPADADTMASTGAIYTGAPVERDADVITARGPESATQFVRELIEALGIRRQGLWR